MPTVYVTAPPDSARQLATDVVEQRLAACVNRLPCQSTYRWDGAVVEDDEEVLLVKTTEEQYDDLVAYLVDEHPYDVPCIERFDEDDLTEAFGAWLDASTRD